MQLPTCANFRNGDCPRSDVKILKEADDFWLVGCVNCGGSRVLSKPQAIGRARYQADQQRLPRMTPRERKAFIGMSHSKPVNLQQGFVLKLK